MRTPRTDALLAKRRASEPRNEIWDVDDVQEFLRHSRQLETELAAMTKELDAEREKVAKLREIATHFLRCPICAYDAAECERGARYMKALDETK